MQWMPNRFGPRALGLALLLAFCALRILDPGPVETLRHWTFDLFQRLKPRVETKLPVRIVDIDEKSLAELGQWPWPRTTLATLLDRLADNGAVTVGFDVLFAEPDRLSPSLIAPTLPGLDAVAREKLAALPTNDRVMANAMRRVRTVLGEVGDVGITPGSASVARSSVATLGGDPSAFITSYPGLVRNVAELDVAAAGRGLFSFRAARDDIVRTVPGVLSAGGVLRPSLAVEMLRVATNTPTILVRRDTAGVSNIVIGGVDVPVDRRGQLWLHFTPHMPARYLSVADVIAGRVPAEAVRGRLVILGASAAGLFDRRATPLEAAMPGAEINAQAIENMISSATLIRPHNAIAPELLAMLIGGLALIWLIPKAGARPSLALGSLLILTLWIGCWLLFSRNRVLLDPSLPSIAVLAIFSLMAFENYTREERQRVQIRGAFSRYVSPDLVAQLARDPAKLVLGGETRELSVLFSDVRGFTAISEQFKDDPRGLTHFMNRLLTPITDAILGQSGTVDKYMGDAVLAFWNAPLDDAAHATHACQAALDMIGRLEALNAVRHEEATQAGTDHLPIVIGIGINTGACTVGNMGSDARFDYSALGDSVNLASRLEALTKSYGLATLVGAETARQAAGEIYAIPVDTVRVKGKSKPEDLYTLIGPSSLARDPDVVRLAQSVADMRTAYRAQDWARVEAHIASGRLADADRRLGGLLDMYARRITSATARTRLPPDWDGVWTFDDKAGDA
jgi:adenylate cyclase